MKPWHGMESDDIWAMWAHHGWLPAVYNTLRDVALCELLPNEMRMTAVSLLNDFTQADERTGFRIMPAPPDENVADLICGILVSMTQPKPRLGWWARRRAARVTEELGERLSVARCILLTLRQWCPEPTAGFTSKTIPEKLLS